MGVFSPYERFYCCRFGVELFSILIFGMLLSLRVQTTLLGVVALRYHLWCLSPSTKILQMYVQRFYLIFHEKKFKREMF